MKFEQVTTFSKWLHELPTSKLEAAILQLEAELGQLEGLPEGPEVVENRIPETNVVTAPVEEISVVEWHDDPEVRGRPCAVAILFNSPAFNEALIRAGMAPPEVKVQQMLRFKSARMTDEFIRSVIKHRYGVWPQSKIEGLR